MTFINRAEVSAAGVLGGAIAVPNAAMGVLGGIGYVAAPTGAIAATTANPISESEGAYVDAFRFNNSGQMFVWNFDASGLPPGGVFYTGGIPFTKDGQLVVTAQPAVWYCGGWPIAANSYVVGVPSGGAAVVPDAPTIGVATVQGVGAANLTFTANGDGGSPILDFLITSSPGAITWVRSVSPSFLSGLTPGIAYTFTVQARNAVGYSLPSAASNSVTT